MAFPAAQPFWTPDWELQEKENQLPEKTQRKFLHLQQETQGWKGEQNHVWVSQKGKRISKALPAYGNRKARVGHGFYITQKPLQGFAETLKILEPSGGTEFTARLHFRCSKWTGIFQILSLLPPQQHRRMGSGGFSHEYLTSGAAFLQSFWILGRGSQGVKCCIYESCQDFVLSQIYWCIFRQTILKLTTQPS